jgi:hypothetical protein
VEEDGNHTPGSPSRLEVLIFSTFFRVIAIRFLPSTISMELQGLTISNPDFAPHWNYGNVITSGVLFGLEDVPAAVQDKDHYPKTLFSVSLNDLVRIPIPK